MTPETSVVVTRVFKKRATMPGSYWCFYLHYPDGNSEYAGASYRGTRVIAAVRFPGYPIYNAYQWPSEENMVA